MSTENKLKIRINPSWTKEEIEEFKQSIKNNNGHCPCQDPSPDTICMCKKFRQKTTAGECGCGLYEKY